MARPFYDRLDWTVVTGTVLLAIISLLTLYSASSSGGGEISIVFRQASWFALGFLLIVIVTSIDYHILCALAYPLYGLLVLALSAVLVFGETVKGAQRWIKIGPISLQPSELAKIALILVLAKYFSDRKKDTVYFTDLVVSGILLGIPVALIIKEPDLGMSVLLFPIFAAIVFVAGIDVKPVLKILMFRPLFITLIVAILVSSFYRVQLKEYWTLSEQSFTQLKREGIPTDILDRLEKLQDEEYTVEKKFLSDVRECIGKEQTPLYQPLLLRYARPKLRLISVPFMWMWLHLEKYQRNRLLAFIRPASDPLGAGYHIRQSQIAIGSGGFWGKGYMNGTQSQLKFLPEQFTDFVFSVFSEEWGFVGSAVLLFIYLILVLKGLAIALKAKDKLGRLIAVGVVTILVVHMFVNVGVTTGIMPVTGLTLPLMSYGGSSIFSTSIALGLLLNVSYRRFDF
jgi:rod shape determining protein RodA